MNVSLMRMYLNSVSCRRFEIPQKKTCLTGSRDWGYPPIPRSGTLSCCDEGMTGEIPRFKLEDDKQSACGPPRGVVNGFQGLARNKWLDVSSQSRMKNE